MDRGRADAEGPLEGETKWGAGGKVSNVAVTSVMILQGDDY